MKKKDEFPLNMYPQLIEEWHPQNNQNLSKEEITLGSSRKVWWKCPKGEEHEWEALNAKITKKIYGISRWSW